MNTAQDQDGSETGQPFARFGFFLSGGFGMLSYASAVDVLKQLNDYYRADVFAWQNVSDTLEPVAASNGLRVLPDADFNHAGRFDYIIIVGSVRSAHYKNPALMAWLRRQFRHGARIGAVTSGAWLLARAGLLDGRRCTIHWRDFDAFRQAHPTVDVCDELYVIDKRIFTCSGASATSDMIYYLLSQQLGSQPIKRVQEVLFHGNTRPPTDMQRSSDSAAMVRNRKVRALVQEIETNIETTISISEMCTRLGLCRRQAEELFRRHLGVSPKQMQIDRRLVRAANLLNKTEISVLEVSVASGYSSASHFSTAFRRRFGLSPRKYRDREIRAAQQALADGAAAMPNSIQT